ncbi:MAG: TolC family protein [Methylococcus sp.]|nr:TolC family protein [Methylococcus sp.]
MRRLPPLFLAATVAACAPTPPPAPEPVAVPAHWRAQAGNAQPKPAPAEWWKTFADPQLDRLVDQALRANADIGQAAARVLQAKAAQAGAEAELRPAVNAFAGVDQVRLPAMRLGGQNFAPEDDTWPYAGFGFDYEVDLLGRLAKGAQSAAGTAAAAEFERRQIRQSVAHEVVKAYLELRHAEALSEIDVRRADLAETLEEQEQRRLASGLSDRQRVNEAERGVRDIRIARSRAERDSELARARLALLVSRPANALALPSRTAATTELTVEPDLPASAVGRRPDVQAAWQRLLVATTDIERTELERYPRVTLTGLAGIVASGFSGWLASDAVGWIVGAAGRLPLYDGGRVQARVDAAAAVRDERFAAYRRSVYLALAEVESALIEWQTARTALEFHASQLASRRQDAARRAGALALGRASSAEILRLDLAAREAEAETQTADYQRSLAYASVQRALGR